jgi:hypothetical protein
VISKMPQQSPTPRSRAASMVDGMSPRRRSQGWWRGRRPGR